MMQMHLKAGDPVTIVREPNNTLSIIPKGGRPDSSNEVTAIILQNESATSLKRKVVSMYLAGYSIMHLKSKTGRINPPQRDAVREVVRRNLVATEIIADASDLITIQVLGSLPELSVNSAIQRMFLISTAMHKDALSSLAEQNYELATIIIKSDDEVDRFSLYILRNLVIALQNENVLQEIGLKGISDCLSYRVVVRSIERVADHAASIADKCLKITDKIPTEVFQKIDNMSRFSLVLLNDSVEAFLNRDYNLADNIVDKVEDVRSLENEITKFLEKVKSLTSAHNESTSVYIKLILEDIRRMAEHACDIAEAAMNETIGEVIEKISTIEDKTKSSSAL
jgi:phosphate uptake regulator